MISVKTIVPESVIDFGFGAYNMSGNSKTRTGLITVGEILLMTSPVFGVPVGYIIGEYGENKSSKAAIDAGKKYQKEKGK